MKLKRCVYFYATVILFSTLTFSAKPYTRQDLEQFRRWSSVADLVFSIPFLVSDQPSDNQLFLMLPTMLQTRVINSALEAPSKVMILTNILRFAKAILSPTFAEECKKYGICHIALKPFLVGVSNAIITKTLSGRENRVKRRIIRIFASFIIVGIFYFKEMSRGFNRELNTIAMANLILILILIFEECLGEGLIRGATKQ